jgi:hypothetical protein
MSDTEIFLDRHERSQFRHRDELLAAILSGECVLTERPRPELSSLPCSYFLHIYQIRARHLEPYTTPHARSIWEDVLDLCEELEKTPDEPVQFWSFAMAPHVVFNVSEGAETLRVLGCIKAVDRRLIAPEAWEALWRGQEAGREQEE